MMDFAPSGQRRRRSWRSGGMKVLALLALLLILTGTEARDRNQVRAFRSAHPCPATGKARGACPGYVVDHVVPLCAGGSDRPSNMQWQEYRASLVKDGEERRLCASMRHGH